MVIQMFNELNTDDEIMQYLANKFDRFRRYKAITDVNLVSMGGTSRAVLDKFRHGRGGISLKTFIRLLRGLGELDELDLLFKIPEQYSPTGKTHRIPKKRVRTKKAKKSSFIWGDANE